MHINCDSITLVSQILYTFLNLNTLQSDISSSMLIAKIHNISTLYASATIQINNEPGTNLNVKSIGSRIEVLHDVMY